MVSGLRRGLAVLGMLGATTLVAAGCGSDDSSAAEGDEGSDGAISVVASTSVWGDVVAQVGGDRVEVTSIISGTGGDPHGYESTPRDAAAVTEADLVVFNGGGYDEFMDEIVASGVDAPVVQAYEFAEEENEHVWYDPDAVRSVANAVADELGTLSAQDAALFTDNAEAFGAELDALSGQLSVIADRQADAPVVATEPLAAYLLADAGLRDVTPGEFTEAIEEETDPPAGAVAAVRDLLAANQARVLVYNPQTETPVTEQVRSDAQSANIPVVEMTETLPEGSSYLEWMTSQIDELSGALP